jgi:uncharacterized protein
MSVARSLWNQRIQARDGIELAADVILPVGTGPFPTLVLRTPYVRSRTLNNPKGWIRLVDYGYALVTVDVRGRNDSDGTWAPFVKDPNDAYDVIEWAATQSWSTGKVGMVGASYDGCTQWWTAISRPPHLVCIAPLCWGGAQHDLPFGSGIPMQYWLWWMMLTLGRTQQFPGAPAWEARIDHTPLSTLADQFGLTQSAWHQFVSDRIDFVSPAATLSSHDYADIDIPVFIGVGWWDDQETMRAWQALQQAKSARDCRLLIGGWDHIGNTAPRPVLGGVDVSASVMDVIGYIEQFLARHLKGETKGIAEDRRCRVFLTGENRWEQLGDWPQPDAKATPWFLASKGNAKTLKGDGSLVAAPPSAGASEDTYCYDPNEPGRDMSSLAAFAWADPPLDHRYLQRRRDVLVYTSEPLVRPVKVSGRYELTVFVSSDRVDTDLYVELSDVHPDGRAIGLAATNEPPAALRLRYRYGPEEALMRPGTVYEVRVPGSWVHHRFKTGHRIRLAICSGNFPLGTRNAGTGKHWAADEILYPQTNTISHSAQYPSNLLLPVAQE